MAVIAIIGTITLLDRGLLALVQDDIKKVLAYSTVSQLGYMVAALAFSYTAGIFHLFTHGFFKALLFLGAGSLIHAVHSQQHERHGRAEAVHARDVLDVPDRLAGAGGDVPARRVLVQGRGAGGRASNAGGYHRPGCW